MKRNWKEWLDDGKNIRDSGRAINDFHYLRMCSMLKEHGGEVVYGNKDAWKDLNLKPTIILNPKKDCAMMQEEIFGCLLPIFTYKELDEAIEFVNK